MWMWIGRWRHQQYTWRHWKRKFFVQSTVQLLPILFEKLKIVIVVKRKSQFFLFWFGSYRFLWDNSNESRNIWCPRGQNGMWHSMRYDGHIFLLYIVRTRIRHHTATRCWIHSALTHQPKHRMEFVCRWSRSHTRNSRRFDFIPKFEVTAKHSMWCDALWSMDNEDKFLH